MLGVRDGRGVTTDRQWETDLRVAAPRMAFDWIAQEGTKGLQTTSHLEAKVLATGCLDRRGQGAGKGQNRGADVGENRGGREGERRKVIRKVAGRG